MLAGAPYLRQATEVFDDGGIAPGLFGWLTSGVLLVLLALLVVMVVIAGVVGWLLYRRVRRSGTLRRWVDTGMMTARARALPPGPAREVAGLRVRLRGARDRARTAIAAARQRGGSETALAHLPALAARLEENAAALDQRLAALERHPPRRAGDALPELREQVGKVEEAEATLHRGLDLSVLPGEAGGMQRLQRDLDNEVQALQTYQDTYRDAGGGRT